MIDERHEELASLYAFDLLDGAERADFERALASNPELRRLVDELRATSNQLALAPQPIEPPAALKTRIEASISARDATPNNLVAFPPTRRTSTVPWAIAAAFAVLTIWLGGRNYALRSENSRLADQRSLAEVTLRSAQAQLEAERILGNRVSSEYASLKTAADEQIASMRESANVARQQVAEARAAQSATESQLAALRQSQASLVAQLAQAEKAETVARAELTNLSNRLTTEGNLSRLKIATLASMLHNSPQALAVAVWDPSRQEGVFAVDKLPASATGQEYELWVIDDKPVSAGVFSVGADGKAKVTFKPSAAIRTPAKFAVSREKDDGAKAHAAPGEVVMISE